MKEKERIDKELFVAENHTGAIWQNSRGAWTTFYRDENGKRKKFERAKRADLIDALHTLYTKRREDFTVEDVYNDWLHEGIQCGEITGATADRYVNDWVRFFERTSFGALPIGGITTKRLETFIKTSISREHLNRKGYYHLKALVRAIWIKAHKEGLTEIVPKIFFDELQLGKKIFAPTKKADSTQVFNDEEVEKITVYLRENPDILNRALLLDFLTGLRAGELCALKKSDLEGRYLHIQRTETRIKGQGENGGSTVVVDHPKTEAGDRTVYLNDEAYRIVCGLLGDKTNQGTEWLFVGETHHKRIIRSSLGHRLTLVCKKVGIPPRSPHKIRKTYASQLIDAGVDKNIITRQMGHTDFATTLGHYYYQHQMDDECENQLEKATASIMANISDIPLPESENNEVVGSVAS